MGDRKEVKRATIRFKDTFSAKVGPNDSDIDPVVFDQDENPLYGGDHEVWFDNENEFLKTCYIVQEDPMPCEVLAMIPRVEEG